MVATDGRFANGRIGINCQKNNVICEGYPAIERWQSGKKRPEERRWSLVAQRPSNASSPASTRLILFEIPPRLCNLVGGIETDVDRRFLHHFVYDLSKVLTVHDNSSNPFKDLLLPMATEHKGLMHSLMALSGSHIVAREPSRPFNDRQMHHSLEAITILRAEVAAAAISAGPDDDPHSSIFKDPTIASTIVHCLTCISAGLTKGEYRVHMAGIRELVRNMKSKNPDFQNFIFEFFMYHEISNSLTSLDRRPIMFDDDDDDRALPRFIFPPFTRPGAGVLMGVLDGLFKFITRITALRDQIRARKAAGLRPTVVYHCLAQAVEIDVCIREWDTGQEVHTAKWIAAELYRQSTWVYLWRTIQPSRPSPNLSGVVDAGLVYLRALPSGESAQCILLMPLFILGCAAFEQRQRPDIEHGFDTIQQYSNLGNIRPVRQIVRKVWKMMDEGDERSWDWETIMAEMGLDLLVT